MSGRGSVGGVSASAGNGFNLPSVGAKVAVQGGIANAQDLGNTAFLEAQRLLNELVDIADGLQSIPNVAGSIGNVTSTVDDFVPSTPPTAPTISASFPGSPAAANVDINAVNDLIIDDVPVFLGVDPNIRDVVPVEKFMEAVPGVPILPDRTNSVPDVPDNTLPVSTSLRPLILPAAPAIINVPFEGALPTALDNAPDPTFNYSEDVYSSTLLSKLNEKLLDQVNHIASTGLNPVIMDQLWNQARERTTAVMTGAVRQVTRISAASGWDQPTGDLQNATNRVVQEQSSADITESRNIAITQANLELTNFQFAFSQGIQLEGQLINHADMVANRALDAAKYVIEAAINVYGLQVSYFNANVELYSTQASVYGERIRGELAKVEVYKAELEGQKLINELNTQDIDNYRAQIEAVVAIFNLYSVELESVKILLEQDALKLQLYESEIKGYAESIRAKSLEYEGYKSELSGEQIKVEMYKGFADAFSAEIDGYKAVVDARIARQDSEIKLNVEVPLDVAKIDTEIFSELVNAESTRLTSLVETYQGEASVYETLTDAEKARIDAQVAVQEQEVNVLVADAELSIEALKANVAALLGKFGLLIEAQKAAAQVQAQLAASYGSSVNYSAGISESLSGSVSNTSTNSSSVRVSGTESISISAS